jgi:hypothetical protein
MPKFKVTLTRPTYEYADVVVKAETIEAAQEKALAYAVFGGAGVSWEGADDVGEPKIIDVAPVDEPALAGE